MLHQTIRESQRCQAFSTIGKHGLYTLLYFIHVFFMVVLCTCTALLSLEKSENVLVLDVYYNFFFLPFFYAVSFNYRKK